MNSNTIIYGKIPSGNNLYYIGTSQLICSVDQSDGLHVVWVSEESNFQTNFCNILQHIVKLKVIQTFKKLLKSESVNRSDLINSVYLWLNFSILFSHVFLGGAPTSICHFFHLSVAHHISWTVYHLIIIFGTHM